MRGLVAQAQPDLFFDVPQQRNGYGKPQESWVQEVLL